MTLLESSVLIRRGFCNGTEAVAGMDASVATSFIVEDYFSRCSMYNA